jgi:hypothetical protein
VVSVNANNCVSIFVRGNSELGVYHVELCLSPDEEVDWADQGDDNGNVEDWLTSTRSGAHVVIAWGITTTVNEKQKLLHFARKMAKVQGFTLALPLYEDGRGAQICNNWHDLRW